MLSNNDWQEGKNEKSELESFICPITEIIIATPTVCEPATQVLNRIKTFHIVIKLTYYSKIHSMCPQFLPGSNLINKTLESQAIESQQKFSADFKKSKIWFSISVHFNIKLLF